jgi:hypothetical protein
MIRLVFPNPETDSPTGKSPMGLRIRLEPRRGAAGAAVRVLYKHGAAELTVAALEGFRMAGAWIETDTQRAARQLLEAFGKDAPVRLIDGAAR